MKGWTCGFILHPSAFILEVVMAKESREMVWMQCESCKDLNYRTEIKVAGGVQKIEIKKFCPRERSHTMHKVKRK